MPCSFLLLRPLLLLLLLAPSRGQTTPIAQCLDDLPAPAPPIADDLPLCGNGVLDPGEVCDDGNQRAGDGCNAYCSAFDAMTAACTLAGHATAACPFGRPQISSPSQSVFCDLRAIDAGPKGDYVIVADAGTLFRYDLFTDNLFGSLTKLSASAAFDLQPICSLAIMPDDGSIVIHECERHKLRLITPNGQIADTIADLHTYLKPSTPIIFRAYYDTAARIAVVAGEPLATADDACVQVWTVSLLSYGTPQLLASIPCIVYNVIASGITYRSYSIVGMRPYSVTSSLCPRRMQQTGSSICYAVTMQRDDLTIFTASMHTEGGTDMAYDLSINTFDNALGIPIVRTLANSTSVYTSRGSCFIAESRLLTRKGRTPPTVTLGNACRYYSALGWSCTTPLNNPFMTDIVSSPYLLPQGLSATHTHTELSAIFSSTCPSATFNSSGALMYRDILRNTYANTTPVDFVPLPRTHDIIYITPTSIGLITTKRTTLFDRGNPGYCRPTNTLYCPPNHFGTVGSVCARCDNSSHPMYGKSVAWQIMCVASIMARSGRRLLSSAQVPTYERFSVVSASNPQDTSVKDTIHKAVEQYAIAKGVPPPSQNTSFLSPLQPTNKQADNMASLVTMESQPQTIIECLIASAENATGRSLFKNKTNGAGAESSTTFISTASDQPMLQAIDTPTSVAIVSPDPKCTANKLQSDIVRSWLPCVAKNTPPNMAAATTRRLLAAAVSGMPINIIENQGTTLGSNTIISWTAESTSTLFNPLGNNTNPPSSDASDTSSAASFPIWAAIVIAAAALVVLLFIIFILYRRGRSSSGSTSHRHRHHHAAADSNYPEEEEEEDDHHYDTPIIKRKQQYHKATVGKGH